MTPDRRRTSRWRTIGTASAVSLATLVPGLSLAGLAAPAAQGADPGCTTSGITTTCTFTYTGATQPLLLPDYVRLATFEVVGAAGGKGLDGTGQGGSGGGVTATLEVRPGSAIAINVGGKGADYAGTGGWNGGGNGAGVATPRGGGGGGASEVLVDGRRVLVGGGGGGGGTLRFGELGSPVPGNGGNGGGAAAGGGAGAGAQGANSTKSVFGAGGGKAGSTAPGVGGGGSLGFVTGGCSFWVSAFAGPGDPGRDNIGGAGGHLSSPQGQACMGPAGYGGGGGGGYRGGGGGGAGVSAGAGGGGGSGYGPAGSTNSVGAPGAHGVVTVTYQEPVSTNWIDTGIRTVDNPTVVARGGTSRTADVFYIDESFHAVQRTFTDGVPKSVPKTIGSETWTSGSRLAAVSSGPDRIDLFARGNDDALWHSVSDGNIWHPWRRVTAPSEVLSSPAVASWGAGRLDVFWRGSNSSLRHVYSDNGGAYWSAPVTISRNVASSPSAVSAGPGLIDVVYNQANSPTYGGVGWIRNQSAGGGWRPEVTAFDDPSRSTIAFLTSPAPGRLSAYYKSDDGSLMSRGSNGGGFGPRTDLGPAPSGYDATVSVAPSPMGAPFGLAVTRSAERTIFIRAI